MREHPHAPIFRNESGNRLTAEDVAHVRAFEREVATADVGWSPTGVPDWLDAFVDRCFETTPFYRRYGARPRDFRDMPTVCRADLGRDIAQFLPDDVAIDRLINFQTSGRTGHPLLIASLPRVAANYLAFHKRALRRFGIELTYGRGQVGVVLVGFQKRCFTYVSVTPTLDEAGLAKINLNPDDWRDPDDRAKYLDALAPEVLSGDPLAFAELATLPMRWRPRALLSTSMALRPASGAGEPVLVDLEGRPPVRIRTMLGEWLNNIEVTHALKRFALAQFTLHQYASGEVRFRFSGARGEDEAIRAALLSLFGPAQPIVMEPNARFDDKVVQYTTDIAEALR